MEVEEEFRSVAGYPGFIVSNLGRVIDNTTGLEVPRKRDRVTRDVIVTFSYSAYTFNGPVWLLMLRAFYNLSDFTDVIVDYRDGDPTNLDCFNLAWSFTDGKPILFRLETSGDWKRITHHGRRVEVNETGRIYENVREMSESLGLDMNAVYMVMRGERKKHHGYSFRYVD